jgi:Peptidase A4 family
MRFVPHNSSHSIWNGIGGYGVAQLLQAGIDTAQSGVQNVYPFIEGLPDDPYEIEVASPSVAVGQSISVTTSYSVAGVAHYTINNLTTGFTHTYLETPSSFNSNSVEWIDERPQNMSLTYYVDDHRYYYRKSTPTAWSAMYANGHPAGYWQTDGLYMYSYSIGTTLANAALNTTTTDTHNWVACP